MLPDVRREQGAESVGKGHRRVASVDDVQLPVGLLNEPRPPRAKVAHRGGLELGLELVHGAEVGLQRSLKWQGTRLNRITPIINSRDYQSRQLVKRSYTTISGPIRWCF